MGFETPTLIQAQAIPVILSGKHVLVNAATVTGTTVAYLAPIIHHLQKYDPRIQHSDGTFGISILVATPGHLLDHLKNTASFVILELGFGKDIEEILELLGSRQSGSLSKEKQISRISDFQRQNLLLSATLNDKVNNFAKISLENPIMIGLDDKMLQTSLSLEGSKSLGSNVENELEHSEQIVRSSNEEYKLPVQLFQRYVKVPCGSWLVVLLSILKSLFERETSYSEFPSLSKMQSEADARQLFLKCKLFTLHGNTKHEDRRTTFQSFKMEKVALLLSTDVAARGLDFPKVRCIIQYDSPGEATEYVHRVGRTARLVERGDSLLFLQPVEMDYLQELEKHGVSISDKKPQSQHILTTSNFFLMTDEHHPRIAALRRPLFSLHNVTALATVAGSGIPSPLYVNPLQSIVTEFSLIWSCALYCSFDNHRAQLVNHLLLIMSQPTSRTKLAHKHHIDP
ncbi:hypothetical protein Vadar_008560 [Vaccinium darrowii]|uniref:Uncharacterized protein n=1 Tax=Vaccinium darrowii TaxID=229202 RepID=A0ACB7ZKC2_9ERIC|nr:hypothetical protein Vadar_008560 [Vaccinium darrowii]